ncbi:hypothetical protein [Streptosporangium roseum]|uniref:Uncharacterized protein n=1 Tax=Streptosporangium roseum (strain ATCC 12428 / DSM 43021 / JCM 3005 / KCTC 9067 / NCIMB 10171 / NRRL 2505 / NI 9100) TaxID=479432 RepID=D2AQC8_STRRD|nr:hypothetical protein [Streptosporangium roseum]ACZ84472.1 hypothetical protein Sros_1479 [Streptosporangium roseum DSM 43021]
MSINRQDEMLKELERAIQGLETPDALSIRKASVEPYIDADGEPALRALLVVEGVGEGGWPADLTHSFRRQVNRLAAEKNLDEYVYVTLFTEQEFQDRERADDMAEYDSTTAIDRALREDQQGGQ